jgi:hypothetical protein
MRPGSRSQYLKQLISNVAASFGIVPAGGHGRGFSSTVTPAGREGVRRHRDVDGWHRINQFWYQRDDKGKRQKQRRTEPFHLSVRSGCPSARSTSAMEDPADLPANETNRSRDERGYRGA